MKKKLFVAIMLIAVAVVSFGVLSASAATEGIYTYYVSGGEVTITDCDTSASGAIAIPDKLGGYPVTSIGDRAFSYCTGLTDITIPDNVTSIGDYAFSYCYGLTSITIPDSVTTIGRDAFSDCSGLTKVNITDIAAWCNIEFFNDITDRSSNPLYYARNLYLNGNLVTNLEIPDGVTSISYRAFRYCTGLKSVTIPDSVTKIAEGAFAYCEGLTKVNITDIAAWCNIEFSDIYSNPLYYARNLYLNGNLVTNLEIPDSVTTIGESAFSYCTRLTSITIPDSVTTISRSAFSWCTGITSITIPDSVTSIGSYAFNTCRGLTSITIPDSVTSIADGAFNGCTGLRKVTVGKGIELIPGGCFDGCENLKYVVLFETVKYIRNDAFNGCSKIEAVFYEGSESQWNEILFYNRNENLTNAKIVYNATKKTYKFETNCGIALPDVNDYAVFSAPLVKNEGKTLVGWYDNEALSGEPITFPYYGNTTTLYAAWTDRTGKSFDSAIVVRENKEYTVTIAESGQMMYYEFVPKYTGEYRFYSTGSYDTYGYLYNSSRDQITYDDDGAGNNFYISYNLTAGNTYYIAAKLYSGTGTFTLAIETDCVPGTKTVCVTAADGNKIFITIPSYLPENTQVILACYKDGRFTELASAPNKNETIYFIAYEDFDYAKVMAWDSFGNMNPLCEAELVQ